MPYLMTLREVNDICVSVAMYCFEYTFPEWGVQFLIRLEIQFLIDIDKRLGKLDVQFPLL